MDQILVYSDSQSWGIIPGTRQRLPFDQRWPGVLENCLLATGKSVRVVENCLNGRRTAWSSPFLDGRDGSQGLAQVIEMHSPLKLVIVMLGTNDFQRSHNNDASLAAEGVAKLIKIIRNAPIEPGMPTPEIMVVAPPAIVDPKGSIAPKFTGADERCLGFAEALETVANDHRTYFFDAGTVIRTSPQDGVHIDQPDHRTLGEAIAHILDKSITFGG
ncbi:MAG: SGNH/GDSL hydrolase family protein [Verrucomicrobiota bacterium]